MKALEEAARSAWAIMGVNAPEFVALGFEDPYDDTITWFKLPNAAEGAGEFVVDAEPVVAVLRTARDTLDPDCLRYLWHSHYIAEEPSEADVSNFPDWVDAGIVFHAPSGKVTFYNSAGIIPNSPVSSGATRQVEVSNADA